MRNATARGNAAEGIGNANDVIKAHDRLIRHLADSFTGSGVAIDDLIQEGRIALWKASERWRGEASLWTYARRSVLSAMLKCNSTFIAERNHESFNEEIHDGNGVSQSGGVANVEASTLIKECLSILSDEERAVVQQLMSGESAEDVGKKVGKSERHVYRVFESALATLRECADA